MEKEQKPILKWMLGKSFRPIIFRVLATYVLIEMNKLVGAVLNAEYIPTYDKATFINEIGSRPAIVRKFLDRLEDLKSKKLDIIYETMQQNGLIAGNSDSTIFHDELDIIFEQEWTLIYGIIEKCQYPRLMNEYYDLEN